MNFDTFSIPYLDSIVHELISDVVSDFCWLVARGIHVIEVSLQLGGSLSHTGIYIWRDAPLSHTKFINVSEYI